SQRRAVVAHSRQRCTQVTTEAVEHRPAPRRIGLVEPLDVSKRVEQEVRLDLRLQHLQSRLEYLRFDSMSLELRFAQFRGASCRALDKVVRSYDETPLKHDYAELMDGNANRNGRRQQQPAVQLERESASRDYRDAQNDGPGNPGKLDVRQHNRAEQHREAANQKQR